MEAGGKQPPHSSLHAPHLGKAQTEAAQLRGARAPPSHVLESQEEQAEQVLNSSRQAVEDTIPNNEEEPSLTSISKTWEGHHKLAFNREGMLSGGTERC